MSNSERVLRQNIVVSRIVDAPVEEVWKAWTDPQRVMSWWGPEGYTSPECRIDLREGGKFVFAMRAPEEMGGQVSFSGGVYQRILPMERLEFTQGLTDKDGIRVEPAQVGMPDDFPKEILTHVTFKRYRCDMTELTVTEFDWPVGQMFVYSIAGLNQSVDKLIRGLSKA